MEKDDIARGTLSSPIQDLGASLPVTRPGATSIDFGQVFLHLLRCFVCYLKSVEQCLVSHLEKWLILCC